MNTASNPTTVKTTATRDDERPASQAVVAAVADADGTSPLDVRPPLATAVDPEALDRLVDRMSAPPEGPGGSVSFAFAGYDVTVRGDGTVAVSTRD